MAFGFVSINGKEVIGKSYDDPNGTRPGIVTATNDNETISIWDTSFHRGDGVFEVMRLLKNGQIRNLDKHLIRLQISATAVGCPLPDSTILEGWLKEAASKSSPGNRETNNTDDDNDNGSDEKAGEVILPGCLRLIATKGGGPGLHEDVVPSVIISWSPLPSWPKTFSLYPLIAPWHPAGFPEWETPIKWTSYGPNVVSTLKAKEHGFTDAILLTSSRLQDSFGASIDDCHILDGPNFAISWIKGTTLYLPDIKKLGLLPSITQDLLRQLAEEKLNMTVEYGIFPLRTLWEADEAYVSSTTRGLIPIDAIGNHKFPTATPWINKLQALLEEVNEGS